MGFRVGIGFDTHRFGGDRPLRIGGVPIPYSTGLVGHSDADVLLHALTDALLGAVGKGDIGEWFPDDQAGNENRDSSEFVREVRLKAIPTLAKIGNIDCTIFAEQPKLGPYKESIRRSLAEIVGIPIDRINVKAKSGEKVGSIGRSEAIAAQVAVLIEWPDEPETRIGR